MKIGLVVPEHGRASQNGRSFKPSLQRRRLQSPETGSCGELQVKVAASNSAFRLHTTFRPVASPAVIRCWLVLRRTSWNRRRGSQAPARHYHECIMYLYVVSLTGGFMALTGFEPGSSPIRSSTRYPLDHQGGTVRVCWKFPLSYSPGVLVSRKD